jgi:CHAT domain-containing protein
VKRVFVCPDGGIALLPFETLPGSRPGGFLVEDLGFVYVQSAEEILEDPYGGGHGDGALLAGGLDYDALPDGSAKSSVGLAAAGSVAFGREAGAVEEPTPPSELRAFQDRFPPLPHTTEEVRSIAAIYRRSHGDEGEAAVLSGTEATEGRIKGAVQGKRYVHLATHGFFLPRDTRTMFDEAMEEGAAGATFDSLHRGRPLVGALPGVASGIALAGANLPAEAGRENGLLTAGEAAWLDLSACDIVTLSACDTGLGMPTRGEHLLGLRRALRLAGARTRVTSLWKVSDEATSELMQGFYRRLWVERQGKLEALRGAQLEMLRRNRERFGEARPETWGAFVLEGDWR